MRAYTVTTRAPAEDPATPPPATGGTPVESTPTMSIAAPARSARARRASTILMIVLAVIVLAEIIAFTGTYFLYSRHYVVTDNAVVDADAIDVNAPASGTMTRWTVAEGQAVREGEYLGRVALSGGRARPQVVVKAPRSGTVAINDVVGDEYVTAGQILAIAYDLTDTWITARIGESGSSGFRVRGCRSATVTGCGS